MPKFGDNKLPISPLDTLDVLRWGSYAPTTEGWYWVDDGNDPVIVCVFKRPGHEYLAIYAEQSAMGKRNFLAVRCIAARWAGPIKEPQST